jgi:hypothetical protein
MMLQPRGAVPDHKQAVTPQPHNRLECFKVPRIRPSKPFFYKGEAFLVPEKASFQTLTRMRW